MGDVSHVDAAMLGLFQAEMDTHVPVLSDGLLALEKGRAGAKEIEAMMRAAHSIKGAARIVGLDSAVRISHLLEDCLNAAKENRITLNSDAVDIMLHAVDSLQRICSPGAGPAESSLQPLLDRLGAVKSGGVIAVPAKPEPVPSTMPARDLVAAKVDQAEPSITWPAVFDDAAAGLLRQELLSTLALNPDRIQIDFSHAHQLTAGALALLAAFAAQLKMSQKVRAVEFHGMTPPVKSVLQLAGLMSIFAPQG